MTVGHVEGGDEELGQWRLGRKWDEFGRSRRFGGVTNTTGEKKMALVSDGEAETVKVVRLRQGRVVKGSEEGVRK